MKKLLCALLICCLLTVFPALAAVHVDEEPPADWPERDLIRLTVFRTGEGDCMLLEAAGEAMMIDGGPFKYREKLKNALNERDISHFKYLFSTHPHDDHIEGLRMLMNFGFTADEFVSVFSESSNSELQKNAVKQAKKSGIPYRRLQSGDELTLGDVKITIINWPDGPSVNARSAMARVEYGDCAALLCADIIGQTQWHFLSELDPALLKADVIKAPHHGLTPIVSEFLDAVDPGFIICTNYHTADKIAKIENQARRRNLPIRFSGEGTVVLECDGTDWYIRQTLDQF